MPRAKAIVRKEGQYYLTLGQFVDFFYTSRFNRDNLHGLAEGEDIDNSIKHRIYNKKDVKELLEVIGEFLEWLIIEKNVARIRISKDITIMRETTLPRIKYATGLDERYTSNECKEGEYYITNGRYNWTLRIEGETFEKMRDKWKNDPNLVKIKEDLVPELEEKNRNARANNSN